MCVESVMYEKLATLTADSISTHPRMHTGLFAL